MSRIIRISLDLCEYYGTEHGYQLGVAEQVRTADKREICVMHAGKHVRLEDVDVALQIVEDTFLSAIGRTIGLTKTLFS